MVSIEEKLKIYETESFEESNLGIKLDAAAATEKDSGADK